MYTHIGVFVIIQAGAAQLFVIQLETERADQVQLRSSVGAQANNVAGVGRNLGLIQDYIKHQVVSVKSAPSGIGNSDDNKSLSAKL